VILLAYSKGDFIPIGRPGVWRELILFLSATSGSSLLICDASLFQFLSREKGRLFASQTSPENKKNGFHPDVTLVSKVTIRE
jgi:hypothetical protein